MSGNRLLQWAGVLVLMALAGACTGAHESPDFYRHTNSQFSKPLGGGDFYWFDVRLSADRPDDSELAEAERMQWLQSWMLQQKSCANGFIVEDRRPFEFLEHNPGRYDLRYKVLCKTNSD